MGLLCDCTVAVCMVGYSPGNRIGSRYVEVTVIGSTGKLLK